MNTGAAVADATQRSRRLGHTAEDSRFFISLVRLVGGALAAGTLIGSLIFISAPREFPALWFTVPVMLSGVLEGLATTAERQGGPPRRRLRVTAWVLVAGGITGALVVSLVSLL